MNDAQAQKIRDIYAELHQQLKSYALIRVKDDELATEIVQEAFMIACSKPEQLLSSPNPQGWLVNTVKYVILNAQREQVRNRKLLSGYLLNMSNAVTFAEDKISLDVLYEDLADKEEFILIKEMAVGDRTQLEMAQARGISLNACKKRVQRAKETLRGKIRK